MLVRDLHSEVIIYEPQLSSLVPECTGGDVGLLQAAVDCAVEHSERSIVRYFDTPGRYVDAAGIGHNDSSGFELICDDSASGGLELDHTAPATFGQQSAEIVRGIVGLRYSRVARSGGAANIGDVHRRVDAGVLQL